MYITQTFNLEINFDASPQRERERERKRETLF
jgi:hypothetical protein